MRPAKLVIAGHEYEVRWIDDPKSGLARHGSPDGVGHTDSDIGLIAVRAQESSPTQQRDTLLHEVIHAVLQLVYLDGASDHFKSKDASERVISALATHLLDTLRRNPELAPYLMEQA